MGIEAIIATLVGVAGVAGGYFGGKRSGRASELQVADSTVALLQAAISELERQSEQQKREAEAKDVLLADLTSRVKMLEGLVTQRAEVEAVHQEVKAVKLVVDRIAESIGV